MQIIYEDSIPFLGEEKAYQLVENTRQKADVLYRPIIGSTRFISSHYPERNYQKLVIKPYVIIFRQNG